MGEVITTQAVLEATGQSWEAWFEELDSSSVKTAGLTAVAAWLTERHPNIGGWSCQVITRCWESDRTLMTATD